MESNRDKLLLSALCRGDEKAFNKLYDHYWEHLFIYVARIVGNDTDAEDIVQEVFVTLWKIREKLDHVNSLKAYLIIIARNRALKHILDCRNKQSYMDSFACFLESHENTTEQAISSNELSSLIDAEISLLPSKMQEIFILSRKESLSHKEIARQLDISHLTVKKQISNSIKYLKLKLGNEYLSGIILFFLFK